MDIPVRSIVTHARVCGVVVGFALFESVETFVNGLGHSVPGHVLQILDAVKTTVFPRITRPRDPKTVEEKFRLSTFGVVVLRMV